MRPYLLTYLIISLLIFSPSVSTADTIKTIKASISKTDSVPQGLYGLWRVYTSLIKADNTTNCPKQTIELWGLEKSNKEITLSNPTTGASASITVNNVVGNTAVFTRKKTSKILIEEEQITLTINQNYFYGTDIQTSKKFLNNKLIKTETATYNLNGTKLNRFQSVNTNF